MTSTSSQSLLLGYAGPGEFDRGLPARDIIKVTRRTLLDSFQSRLIIVECLAVSFRGLTCSSYG